VTRDAGRRHRAGARVVDFVVAPRARDIGVGEATARVIICIDGSAIVARGASATAASASNR